MPEEESTGPNLEGLPPNLKEYIEKTLHERSIPRRKVGQSTYGGTYYKKHFAEELRFVLDAIAEDQKDRIYYYTKFPNYTKSTLEMKIRQSWHYLMDNMDPDNKYKLLWSKVQIAEDKNKTGIRLKVLKNAVSAADVVMPDVVEDETKAFDWRPDLDKYLMEAPSGAMFKRDVNLMDETVENLIANLSQLEGIEFKISNRKILIIKE